MDRRDKHKSMEEIPPSESAVKASKHMPRYTVDTYMASKGVDVKGEMSSGGS